MSLRAFIDSWKFWQRRDEAAQATIAEQADIIAKLRDDLSIEAGKRHVAENSSLYAAGRQEVAERRTREMEAQVAALKMQAPAPRTWPYEIAFIPGELATQAYWDYAKQRLEQLGLLKLLYAFNVRKVRVVKQLPPPLTRGMTISQADRAILVMDQLWMPASSFVASLLHEGSHLYQLDHGYFGTYPKNEWQAYTLTLVYHLLAGDGIEVFHQMNPNAEPVYRVALALARQTWPDFFDWAHEGI